MSASASALIVAVFGVLGTLVSGALAHRSGLRAKVIEFEHIERLQREERLEADRRAEVESRRASYVRINQAVRHWHSGLFLYFHALRDGAAADLRRQEEESAFRVLRDSYAEAQMIVPDNVLTGVGDLILQLSRTQQLLYLHHDSRASPSDAFLAAAEAQLESASRILYEVRQTMRTDLGITTLPIERPDGYTVREPS